MSLRPELLQRKVPINWSILRERVGTCPQCGTRNQFKKWLQLGFPLPYLYCPECFQELCMSGAVKDYFRERY